MMASPKALAVAVMVKETAPFPLKSVVVRVSTPPTVCCVLEALLPAMVCVLDSVYNVVAVMLKPDEVASAADAALIAVQVLNPELLISLYSHAVK